MRYVSTGRTPFPLQYSKKDAAREEVPMVPQAGKSAGSPGDRRARAVGTMERETGRTGTRPALAEGKVYAGGNGGIQGGIRSGRSALIKIESELI